MNAVNCKQREFDQWLTLRGEFRAAKAAKQYRRIIDLVSEILILDAKAKFISIMVPLFYRDAGLASLHLGEKENAIKYLILARDSFLEYRRVEVLNSPEDFLKDIASIEKKLLKLNTQILT